MSLVDLGKRLLEAAKTGNTDEVRNLMASGAPFTTDWLGTSPLHFGSRCGHIGTAEVLLRAGISRDARTKVDRTPLHAASQEGHNDIVELLLKHSADVDAKDMLKMTPLHWACEKGHAPVASLLMCHGADINCLDKFDRSPLDIAYAKCRGDIVQILQGPAVNEQIILGNDADNLVEVPLPDSQEEVSAPSTEVTLAMSSPTSSKTYTTVPSTDQSSTSVLATLAALAEATAPISQASTNTSAAEALNWLETHGITMVTNNETSSIVASQLESGQTFTLTEAGKLALNYVKGEQQETDKSQVKQSPTKSQKVITLVTDTGDHVEIVTDGQEGQGESDESPSKKLRLVGPQGTNITDWLQDKTNGDDAEHATLKHQLEEIQKQADEYKEQLKQKEEEADEYRRKLEAINTPTTT